MTDQNKNLIGIAAVYDDVNHLIDAAERVRDAGYRQWDCHTPYPVHGLERAMGAGESPVPIICILSGFLGIGAALLMQGWMNAIDYPIVIGGKPLFSWPAFVPITFELFVLFAALSITGSLIVFCRLWRWNHPLHHNDLMPAVTGDKFVILLESRDPLFRPEAARKLLQHTSSIDIKELYEPCSNSLKQN